MAIRQLDYGWKEIVSRLTTTYRAVVVVAAAYVRGGDGEWRPEAITIRGGLDAPDRDHDWGRIRIVRTRLAGGQAASILVQQRIGGKLMPFSASLIDDQSSATWVTQGSEFGLIAPTETPRLYHSYPWTQPGQPFDLYAPLAARGQPYYPTARVALLELLYGRTNVGATASPTNRLEVSLAYDQAYIGNAMYVEGEGLVVDVRSTPAQAARGHELHVVWQMNASDSELANWCADVSEAGALTAPVPSPPVSYWVALLDSAGNLLDQVEGQARAPQQDDPQLPPTALLDSFEFLDSAWRNFFKTRLIERPSIGGVAELSQPVRTFADFSSRITRLDDLMKAVRVDSQLLPQTKEAQALPESASVGRMHRALGQVLSGPDADSVHAALDLLSATNGIRVALQHKIDPKKRSDLPIALARLGIDYPPADWSLAWEVVRRRVVDAVAEIRRALLANLPN